MGPHSVVESDPLPDQLPGREPVRKLLQIHRFVLERAPQTDDARCKLKAVYSRIMLTIGSRAGCPLAPSGVRTAVAGQIWHEQGSSEGTLRRGEKRR